MPDQTAPDTRIFHLLHQAFRDDAHRLVPIVRDLGVGDTRLRPLARWFEEFRRQVHGHHRAEDEVYFPAIAERSSTFAGEHDVEMDDDHRYLSALVDRVAEHFAAVAQTNGRSPREIEALQADVSSLAQLMDDHFAYEERHVVPMIEALFTAEEFEQLGRRADRVHGARDMVFLVPWFFDHVDGTVRAELLREGGAFVRVLRRAFLGRYRRITRAAGLAT